MNTYISFLILDLKTELFSSTFAYQTMEERGEGEGGRGTNAAFLTTSKSSSHATLDMCTKKVDHLHWVTFIALYVLSVCLLCFVVFIFICLFGFVIQSLEHTLPSSQLGLVLLLGRRDGRRGNDLAHQPLLDLAVGRRGRGRRDVLVAVGSQTERRVDASVHLVRGVVLDHRVTRHHGHLALVRIADRLHVLGDVHDAAQEVVLGGQPAREEHPVGEPREEHQRRSGQDHGQRAEGEELRARFLVEHRVSATDTDEAR